MARVEHVRKCTDNNRRSAQAGGSTLDTISMGNTNMNNDLALPATGVNEPPPEAVEAHPPRTTVEAHNVALTVLAVLAVVFVLHWAQAVFIPLVVGIMINYALSPLVTTMEKWHIPRAIGAGILLLAIVAGVSSTMYSLSDDAGQLRNGSAGAHRSVVPSVRGRGDDPVKAICPPKSSRIVHFHHTRAGCGRNVAESLPVC